jgi:siroheme synthase-like protein
MERNNLFPVFLKLEELHTLLVGAGNVGYEKLEKLLQNSPAAKITVVADEVSDKFEELANTGKNVRIIRRKFFTSDLTGKDILILATDDPAFHKRMVIEARKRKILTNVADTPEICDFYLGAIVQKGDLKIGISTNGKSPTLAKRLKEMFNELIPDHIQGVLDNLNRLRAGLKGDFKFKIVRLNEITKSLIEKQSI